jgi:methylated-DNA-[protein]-cysteine S-methyltransferase
MTKEFIMRTTRTVPSAVGELLVVANTHGLQAVLWDGEHADTFVDDDRIDGPHDPSHIVDCTARQLGEYFAGERTEFDVPLDPAGTPFQLAVWTVLRSIPYGTTITYGEQARRLGDANKARAVGAANGRNPLSIIVPCHRVVGSNGKLTGFAAGLEAKEWLLRHERGDTLPGVLPTLQRS